MAERRIGKTKCGCIIFEKITHPLDIPTFRIEFCEKHQDAPHSAQLPPSKPCAKWRGATDVPALCRIFGINAIRYCGTQPCKITRTVSDS